MAWTDPAGHVWAVGEIVTAANMNTYIGNDLIFLGTPPQVHAYQTALSTLTSGVNTALPFDTERFDTDTMHSTSASTSHLVATTAGKYLVWGWVAYAANATAQRRTSLRLNGATDMVADERQSTAAAGIFTQVAISIVYAFSATDFAEVLAQQASGGNLAVAAAAGGMSWQGF